MNDEAFFNFTGNLTNYTGNLSDESYDETYIDPWLDGKIGYPIDIALNLFQIILTGYGGYVAYKRYKAEESRSSFKVYFNRALIAVFLIWCIGDIPFLVKTVLFLLISSASNTTTGMLT